METRGGLRELLGAEHDPANFVVFRVGFGLLAAAAAIRYVAYGWVEVLLVRPIFHFAWFGWVVEPPAAVLYGLFAAQAVAGFAIALRWLPRLWLTVWLASFGYVELIDKALYLNHYVLFTLVGATLLVTPVHRLGFDRDDACPGWVLWLLRAEFGLVWFWAGLAKINGDWLLRAEPLTTWLQARADFPLIGSVLAWDPMAYAMSWGGMVYDLLIPFLLLLPRTRRLGLAWLLVFHVAVGVLFPIGIFPWLMVLGALMFLEADWPRLLLTRPWAGSSETTAFPWAGTAAWVLVFAILALFPARFLVWGTDVNWTERGYRLAWRVLLNEKTGLVDYRVVDRESGETWRVMPSDELTELQHKQMRTQPDMIRDYALHLEQVKRQEGRDVAVYVDAFASMNGRSSQRYIRSDLDLTQPVRQLDAEGWILPLKER